MRHLKEYSPAFEKEKNEFNPPLKKTVSDPSENKCDHSELEFPVNELKSEA